jgi:hypothetical protein
MHTHVLLCGEWWFFHYIPSQHLTSCTRCLRTSCQLIKYSFMNDGTEAILPIMLLASTELTQCATLTPAWSWHCFMWPTEVPLQFGQTSPPGNANRVFHNCSVVCTVCYCWSGILRSPTMTSLTQKWTHLLLHSANTLHCLQKYTHLAFINLVTAQTVSIEPTCLTGSYNQWQLYQCAVLPTMIMISPDMITTSILSLVTKLYTMETYFLTVRDTMLPHSSSLLADLINVPPIFGPQIHYTYTFAFPQYATWKLANLSSLWGHILLGANSLL